MIRLAAVCLLLSGLAACGLDGRPERPEPKEARSGTGISVTGDGYMGVSGSI